MSNHIILLETLNNYLTTQPYFAHTTILETRKNYIAINRKQLYNNFRNHNQTYNYFENHKQSFNNTTILYYFI